MNELTVDKAIEAIDKALSLYQGNRQDHIILINSLNLVKQELAKVAKQEEKPE